MWTHPLDEVLKLDHWMSWPSSLLLNEKLGTRGFCLIVQCSARDEVYGKCVSDFPTHFLSLFIYFERERERERAQVHA